MKKISSRDKEMREKEYFFNYGRSVGDNSKKGFKTIMNDSNYIVNFPNMKNFLTDYSESFSKAIFSFKFENGSSATECLIHVSRNKIAISEKDDNITDHSEFAPDTDSTVYQYAKFEAKAFGIMKFDITDIVRMWAKMHKEGLNPVTCLTVGAISESEIFIDKIQENSELFLEDSTFEFELVPESIPNQIDRLQSFSLGKIGEVLVDKLEGTYYFKYDYLLSNTKVKIPLNLIGSNEDMMTNFILNDQIKSSFSEDKQYLYLTYYDQLVEEYIKVTLNDDIKNRYKYIKSNQKDIYLNVLSGKYVEYNETTKNFQIFDYLENSIDVNENGYIIKNKYRDNTVIKRNIVDNHFVYRLENFNKDMLVIEKNNQNNVNYIYNYQDKKKIQINRSNNHVSIYYNDCETVQSNATLTPIDHISITKLSNTKIVFKDEVLKEEIVLILNNKKRVIQVKKNINGNEIYHESYERFDYQNYVKITNNKNKIFFETYTRNGQLKDIIDQWGNSSSREYIANKDNALNQVVSIGGLISRNKKVIEDGDFANYKEYASDNAWQRDVYNETRIYPIKTAFANKQVLCIDKKKDNPTMLSQEIRLIGGKNRIQGFYQTKNINGYPKINIYRDGKEFIKSETLADTQGLWRKFEVEVISDEYFDKDYKIEFDFSYDSGETYLSNIVCFQGDYQAKTTIFNNRQTLPWWEYQHQNQHQNQIQALRILPPLATVYSDVLKINGLDLFGKYEPAYAERTIELNAQTGEKYIFNIWLRNMMPAFSKFCLELTLNYVDKEKETIKIESKMIDSSWTKIMQGFIIKAKTTSLHIKITNFERSRLSIGDMIITKEGELLNPVAKVTSLDQAKLTFEDFLNYEKETQIIGTNEQFGFHYDGYGNLRSYIDYNGNVINYTYDTSNNLIGESFQTKDGSTNKKRVIANYRVIKDEDDLGNTTQYEYDEFGNCNKVIQPNSKQINMEFVKEALRKKDEKIYQINNERMITKIEDEMIHTISYDTFNRIKKIRLQDKTMVEYTYSTNNYELLASEVFYSDDPEKIIYEILYRYDAYDNLTKIIENKNMQNITTDDFLYDASFNLTVHIDRKANKQTLYSYDESGNFLGMNTGDILYTQETDEKGRIQSNNVSSINTNERYEYDYQDEYAENDVVLANIRLADQYKLDLIDGNIKKNGLYGTGVDYKNIFIPKISGMNLKVFQFLKNHNSEMTFNVDTINVKRFDTSPDGNNLTISFWIRPRRIDSFAVRSFLLIDDSEIYMNNVGNIIAEDQQIDKLMVEEWNFVSVQLNNPPIEGVTKMIWNINGEFKERSAKKRFELNKRITIKKYHFDSIELASIYLSRDHLSNDTINKLYNEGKALLFQPESLKQSAARIYQVPLKYEFISLNGSLKSTENRKPHTHFLNEGYLHTSKTHSVFDYDDELKRFVFGSYPEGMTKNNCIRQLVYDFNMGDEGTIAFKFKVDSGVIGKKTLLSFCKDNRKFTIYVKTNNQIVVSDLEETVTTLFIKNDQWHQLVLTWNNYAKNYDLYLDKKKFSGEAKTELISVGINLGDLVYAGLKDLYTSFGFDGKENGGNNYLYGKLEHVLYKKEHILQTEVNKLYDIMKVQDHIATFDALGRVKNTVNRQNNVRLSTDYSYKKYNNYETQLIEKIERSSNISYVPGWALSGRRSLVNYYSLLAETYSYDAMLNLKTKYNAYQKMQYTYNQDNRIIAEIDHEISIGTTYTYDNNGNIKTKIYSDPLNKRDLTYYYDSNNRDRLVRVTKRTLSGYIENSYVYNDLVDRYRPIKIGETDLTWNKKKLVKYGPHEYSYNSQGIRIKKVRQNAGKSETTHFMILNNQIICEYGENEPVNYRYNNNQEVVGFSYKGKEYQYVRDIAGIIYAVIDEQGYVMVSYKYDAYGYILESEAIHVGGEEIKKVNHMVYKGYYYDEETGFYYLKSRYYDPYIGRFISADDIEYALAQMYDKGGMNLFAYCNNNPVMYSDPSGNFAISLLIAGFVIGAIVGSTASVISQGLTNGWDNINGWQVLLDGSISGLSGLLAFTGIGAMGSALISGGLGFVGSVGGDLIASNGNWNEVNWIKAVIMTITNGLLGAGAGANNSKAIGKDLWKSVSKTKVGNIFTNAAAKTSTGQMTQRGFQGLMNLYGKSLAASITNAMPNVMANRITNSFIGIGVSGVIDVIIGWFI